MRHRSKLVHNDSAFSRWLQEQARSRGITLTELGRLAGLSTGTLRGIITVPDRQPSLDTCLRLARALNLPPDDVFVPAGLTPPIPTSNTLPDPDRTEFLQLYDSLPVATRRALLETIRTFPQLNQCIERATESG